MAKQENAEVFENHIIWHDGYITRQDRNTLNRHQSGLLWLTGLSGSGKSTIAHLVEKELFKRAIRGYVLDGDNIRYGINSDLGFSRDDRRENLRRIVEVSKLLVDAGIIVLASFISPYREDRAYARRRFKRDNFFEIYVKCSVEECERRDPKGKYKKARQGIIKNYTGISSPYEEPEDPDLIIDAEKIDIDSSAQLVLRFLNHVGLVPPQ